MAPSARQVQKAEAKYGVATEYPDLQLHSAAANGNVGLVKYALMHGQPVNSVLNGVLPIHIAASSGNELVVQMLIEAGADVNAARLPRKYNADRAKAISSIGAAGSTPLHFAAANGHANVVSVLLSHGANPDVAEKHNLTPEDLAKEAGHENVLTALRLWRQSGDVQRRGSEGTESMLTVRGSNETPTRRVLAGSASTNDLRSAAAANNVNQLASSSASIHSVASSTRKMLKKPSLETLSLKSKKLAKAASNPNLAGLLHGHSHNSNAPGSSTANPASAFAPQPTALRQNPLRALSHISNATPSQTMQRQATLPASGTPHIHHIINIDKGRRPSLPSVFEKAAHPSHSIKSALGITSTSSAFGSGRSNSSSTRDNDPYHIGRPKRSASRTSLSSVFRHNQSKDRGSEGASQPLSPAASSFFTGDDELEQAERDAFLRTDRDGSADEGYQQQLSSNHPYSQQHIIARRASNDGFQGRSRAGSGSSAATTGSGRSYSQRGYSSSGPPPASASYYPTTAPPTQSTFFPYEHSNSSGKAFRSRPVLSPHSSSSYTSVRIPAPIPAPPSSSTQPFFSKAAISAAHNNPPISRPGFYRPRKSSQLSNSASTLADRGAFLQSSDTHNSRAPMHARRFEEALYDEDDENGTPDEGMALAGPSVVIRRPTIQETPTSSYRIRNRLPTSPAASEAGSSFYYTPKPTFSPPASSVGNRHSRASSDGAGTVRSGNLLPDVLEDATGFDFRQRSQSHGPPFTMDSNTIEQEMDAETARESEDTFPTDQERPFMTRSRAGSRARVDSVGSNGSSAAGYQSSPVLSSGSSGQPAQHPMHGLEPENSWSGITRAARSGSTTTDTRTSRSGSLGEGGVPQPRFLGFDYSSSPASTSSIYQPSNSTTATSVVSSPPGTASNSLSTLLNQANVDRNGTTVTHAQAQSMVRRKEEELLSYAANSSVPPQEDFSTHRRLSLSQQLAAYGDSLAIERELGNAEQQRRHPAQSITLTIPEPPASAKYSWEILGKESRTSMPVTKGKRAKDGDKEAGVQKLWTHKMVSPFEVPLNRPVGSTSGHKPTTSTGSAGTLTSSGKPLTRVSSNELSPSGKSLQVPLGVDPVSSATSQAQTIYNGREHALKNKASTLSANASHLAPPALGSDLSVHRRSPRLPSPGGRSPRSSSERDRERPSNTYHVVAGPGSERSEPTDSANSSMISEPRSSIRHVSGGSSSSHYQRHRHSRSDAHSASPDMPSVTEEAPRPQLLRLETIMAPKYHAEQRAGGEAAPSPTKSSSRFGKIGKLFKN